MLRRFVALLGEPDRFPFVGDDVALFDPCKEELRRLILGAMRTEVVEPPAVTTQTLSTYLKHRVELRESGNLTVRIDDELPDYGISLFDDRIAVGGDDVDAGAVQILLDTDAAAEP